MAHRPHALYVNYSKYIDVIHINFFLSFFLK